MQNSYDCIIIGSGAGGLTAGALLSKAGLRTIVLESEAQAGGYLCGFERKGFHFNSSIEWLSECGEGGFVYDIFKYIGSDFPECTQMKKIHRFRNDNTDYLLTSNPLKLRDTLIKDFPEDESGIRRMFNEAEKLGKILKVLNRKIRSGETKSLIEKILDGIKMPPLIIPMIKYIRTPVEKGLKQYFSSETARRIFGSQETMMSVMVPIAWAFNGNFQRCPIGGSQALADWLNSKINSSGAEVELNTRVEKIIIDDQNRAEGVELTDGRKLYSRYVIAACDALTLYEKMIPVDVTPEKLRDADIAPSNFAIFIGLDCPASEFGFSEETLNLTRSGLERSKHISGDPNQTIIIVTSPSERDPSSTPPGKGSICIHCPSYMDYENNWKTETGNIRGDAYKILKNEFAKAIIARLEKDFAHGLSNHIEVMEIATPITYWRYTGNTKGSISGVKPTGTNIRARLAHHRTPIKNLLIGGHCGEYGGGVPMAVKSAYNTGLIVLKDLNRPEYQKLKKIMDA